MGSKRGNGEGSIYQRADGKWCGSLTLSDGKRRVLYGRTRQDVAKRLAVALRDAQFGMAPPPQRESVGKFLERWLEDCAKQSVRPSTYVTYRAIVKHHLIPELGRVGLTKLTPAEVQRLLAKKLLPEGSKPGLSPRRVQMIRATLRVALNQALKWELVVRNVATLADSPPVVYPQVEALSPVQARAIMGAMASDRLEALYLVALAIGLRQGELLGLRWRDVDLVAGTLHVAGALQRIEGEYRLVEPKTKRSRRLLNLPEVVTTALRAHRIRQVEEQLAAEDWIGSPWDLVFTTHRGAPLDGNTVTHRFQRLLRRANLERMRFYDLRHGCATLLLDAGESPRMIMEILGHSQISLTMNTYAHILPAAQQQAATKMDAMLVARA